MVARLGIEQREVVVALLAVEQQQVAEPGLVSIAVVVELVKLKQMKLGELVWPLVVLSNLS